MENKISPYVLNGTEMVEKNIKTKDSDILIKTKDVTEDIVDDIGRFYTGWKKFAFKDRIIDVAVGMIVGTSFKNTVNSIFDHNDTMQIEKNKAPIVGTSVGIVTVSTS